jgi:hypothetical protein
VNTVINYEWIILWEDAGNGTAVQLGRSKDNPQIIECAFDVKQENKLMCLVDECAIFPELWFSKASTLHRG